MNKCVICAVVWWSKSGIFRWRCRWIAMFAGPAPSRPWGWGDEVWSTFMMYLETNQSEFLYFPGISDVFLYLWCIYFLFDVYWLSEFSSRYQRQPSRQGHGLSGGWRRCQAGLRLQRCLGQLCQAIGRLQQSTCGKCSYMMLHVFTILECPLGFLVCITVYPLFERTENVFNSTKRCFLFRDPLIPSPPWQGLGLHPRSSLAQLDAVTTWR